MAKILFFNPPLKIATYLDTNVKVGAPSYPSLTLASLAGHLFNTHKVKVIDLDLPTNTRAALIDEIKRFKPDIVASSANTPNYLLIRDIMREIKKKYPQITTIVGGVHITACPQEASAEGCFDILVLGEGDKAISEILSSSSLKDIPGIIYRDNQIKVSINTPKRELLGDINSLPYPAWPLFEIKKYKSSRLSSRRNPAGLIETSRGCAFQCNYCSKIIFGTTHRVKEPRRVVDEMEYMLKSGFEEIHIADDSFTQDIERAKEVCREIIRRKLKFPWSLLNGIRVNMLDTEFLKLARYSGCWQVGFGIESGDQDVLNRVGKGITLAQIERGIRLTKKAGLDTFGFFVFALAGETEESMQKTIDFAKRLPLDTAKVNICIPYPGTRYYDELKAQGRIFTTDWSKYVCHQISYPVFQHENLNWETISIYYKKAFREFYLRPGYIIKRFLRGLKTGDIFYDIQYLFGTRW